MKKIFTFLAVLGLMTFTAQYASAQDEVATSDSTEVVMDTPAEETTEVGVEAEEATVTEVPVHQAIKTKFIEGGAGFMTTVIACLIFGLAIAIERIIYLNLASTNTDKLLKKVEAALNEGGVEAAKDVCRNTRGPVASIFYQGLLRMDQGVEVVEKSITSYGSVEMGRLESGLSWITLFIAIAPMLGFMGTVIGMIQAFDQIQAAGDISPALVAGGMKVALITTVGGLIVAIVLQIFYNYLISKVDSIVVSMEDSSISLVDMLVKYQNK